MDLRQLKYFVNVCRFRNLSHAANYCNVASSALSHHIKNLELELEKELFIRTSVGMEPTAAGLDLLVDATKILASVENTITKIKSSGTEISGSISIGMPYSVIKIIGADLMRSVINEFPKVRLLIREGLSGVTFNGIMSDQLQFALVFNPSINSSVECKPILEEEIFCIGHSSVIGSSEDSISLDEMTNLPVVLLESGVLSRALLDKPSAIAKLEESAIMQLASIAATLCALTEGLGCTLAPKSLVMDLLETKELKARPVTDPKPLRTLFIVSSKGIASTDLREAMMGLVGNLVKKAVDEGRWSEAQLI